MWREMGPGFSPTLCDFGPVVLPLGLCLLSNLRDIWEKSVTWTSDVHLTVEGGNKNESNGRHHHGFL